MSPRTPDEVRRIVLRGLHQLAPNEGDHTTVAAIAKRYALDEPDVKDAVLELRRVRLARKRKRQGEYVWEPWR